MVRLRWIGALVVAVGLIAVGTPARSAAQPDSINQPPQDGCERNPGGLLAGTSPQWVYVNRDPSPQYAVGTARNARPTETDLGRVHDSYDMNIFFAPDAAYQGLLGTANTSTAETQDKDEQGTMEIEWEQRAQPLFSWPTEDDRVDIMGSWIWDCGHWGPQDITPGSAYLQPGTQPGEVVTGERTEFHPP